MSSVVRSPLGQLGPAAKPRPLVQAARHVASAAPAARPGALPERGQHRLPDAGQLPEAVPGLWFPDSARQRIVVVVHLCRQAKGKGEKGWSPLLSTGEAERVDCLQMLRTGRRTMG